MLTFEEFIGKKCVILEKANWDENFLHIEADVWHVVSIKKNDNEPLDIYGEIMNSDDAYESYLDRMKSYGFKKFKVFST